MGKSRIAGFTLIEMIVVIALVAVLAAIIVPIGRRLRVDNRKMTCQQHLQAILQALKMYRLDEGQFPYFDPIADGPPRAYSPALDPDNRRHFGLMLLLDGGYITNPRILTCGDDRSGFAACYDTVDPCGPPPGGCARQTADVVEAYVRKDCAADAWPYQPFRGQTTDDIDPVTGRNQLYRQLVGPRSDGLPGGGWGSARYWVPDDTTIVTWCPHHAKRLTRGGRGQYLVLYYDGRINEQDASLFAAGGGWRVQPEQ
jgi:prepilin-type N-terminal cleavage/methylation domain-containing protein